MRYDVVIVGAGITGLSCARILHRHNLSFVILESTDRSGGRIKTDIVDGFHLDHGFQVLQTGYPEAANVLDFDKLQLKKFPSGVAVRFNKRFHIIADPRRHPRHLFSTLTSPVGTLKDRLLMLRLANGVCRGPLEELFQQKEQPAISFLREWGFSNDLIERFFIPFFAGVCLDPQIAASSRVLKYVFRVFTQGDAALPASGMGEIPRQIAAGLPRQSIRYNSKVIGIDGARVTIEDGTVFHGRTVVLAVSQKVLPDLLTHLPAEQSLGECCLYYSADWLPPFKEPFLVLNGEGQGPINNVAFPSLVSPAYAPPGKTLIAVVVLGKEHLAQADLEQRVRDQCADWFGRQAQNWDHLRTFRIENGLPVQQPPTSHPYVPPEPATESLHIAGEYQSLPGIQWALLSGRMAAESIISKR